MNILVIGSSVIDIFLQIENRDGLEIKPDEKACFNIGDKIPVDIKKMTIGGGGANVSVGLRRLGNDIKFFTYLGRDIFSKEIQEVITKEGVKLILDNNQEKSSLSFIFDVNKDRIIFYNHEKRDYSFDYKDTDIPDFTYLASIGDYWENAYKNALEFVKANNIPLFLAPGSHQFETRNEVFGNCLKNAEIVFMNKDEAEKIIMINNISSGKNIKGILSNLKSLGPKIVSITDGENGSYVFDGSNYFSIESFQKGTDCIIEKAGAGDAYASAFVASFVSGHDILTCMKWGSINSHYSMQKVGAQDGLLKRDDIEKIIDENKEFNSRKIND